MNVISWLVIIAIDASVAPKDNDPVSPINTLAGLVLKNKNPSNDPTKIKQKTAISGYKKGYPFG